MKETRVIIKPLLTEKGQALQESNNEYPFEVHRDANKVEIRKAIEKLFNVKVQRVNIMNRAGKRRRRGMRYGTTAGWKKAIVKLHPGSRLDLI